MTTIMTIRISVNKTNFSNPMFNQVAMKTFTIIPTIMLVKIMTNGDSSINDYGKINVREGTVT